MSDWRETTLGEVAGVTGGGTPSSKEPAYWGGKVLWVTPGEITKREGQTINSTERMITVAGLASSSAKMLPEGAVLLTSRATVGAVALAGQPMATNQGFQSLVAGPDVVPRFRMYWIQHNREQFTARASGSTFPEISGKKVKTIPIALPSLNEQRRIADVVAAVDSQVEALEAEAVAATEAQKPLAEGVIAGVGGESVQLGDVLQIVRGGSPRPIDDYFTEDASGLNWIKIGDVPAGGKYITATAQKIRPEGLKKTRFVKSGSFLLSNSMSFGRPYILKIDGCIHDGWLSLTDTDKVFDQDYLYYLLRGAGVQAQFEKLAAGSGVRNLNIKSVRTVEVALPTIESQRDAVARLTRIRE